MKTNIGIAIVDDDADFRDNLQNQIKSWMRNNQIIATIHQYTSGEDFLQALETETFTVIFLDMYMESLTGIDTALHLRKDNQDSFIVFCTTSSDFMADAFSVHAFDYLLKPLSVERLEKVLADIAVQLPQLRQYITIDVDRRQLSIFVSDITYVSTSGHYLTIHTTNKTTHTTRLTLSELQNQLSETDCFLEINRGLMVNMNHVSNMAGTECTMNDRIRLPIRVRQSNEIVQKWLDFCFHQIAKDQNRTS